jgi:protein-disulfide isomerase
VASSGKRKAADATARAATQRKRFMRAIVLLGVVGAGVLVYLVTRPAPDATVQDTGTAPPPAESAKGYTLGKPDAPVQIREFADFECPACANYAVVTEPDVRTQLVDKGLATITYFDYPLPMHKNTWWASHAAACANDQGKFWEMHDRLFAGQAEWNGLTTNDPLPIFAGYAKDLGLDVPKWRGCVKDRLHQRDIEARKAEAERLHVRQTPTFYVGQREISGSIGFDQLRAVVDSALHSAKPSSAPTS